MAIEEITSFAHYLKVTGEDGAVVIDGYTQWCGPCKQMAPLVLELSQRPEFAGVRFYKFDTEAVADVAHELGIRQVPSFSFFRDGDIQDGFSGANVKKLEDCVRSIA